MYFIEISKIMLKNMQLLDRNIQTTQIALIFFIRLFEIVV